MIKPLVCFTAAGLVVHNQQVLLVRHKKLGIWLAPGGHLEAQELPHEAALREVFEESGIRAAVVSSGLMPQGGESLYQPIPLLINLHWICKENYQARIASDDTSKPHQTSKWARGCEQHLVWLYRMTLVGSDTPQLNLEECTDIGWFGREAIETLETIPEVKIELRLALQ